MNTQAGGALEVDSGSLTLNGANGYSVSTTITGGTVICGNQFALGESWYDGGGEVPLYMTGGTLNLNTQHDTFDIGGGIRRTGVMVGDLNGTGGTITDNSTVGGGFLSVDLDDDGGVSDTFSGQFLMGADDWLPNMSIDVGGVHVGGDIDGNPPHDNPDYLELNGQTLDFGTLDEWNVNGPGSLDVGTLSGGGVGTTTMYAHTLEVGQPTDVYTSYFSWHSTGTFTVSPDALPGEAGAPSTGSAMVYGSAEFDDGEMDLTDAPLTVEGGGTFFDNGVIGRSDGQRALHRRN